MNKLFTTLALATAMVLGATTTASALSGVSGGWHCWFTVSEKTCYWPHSGKTPYYNLDGSRNMSAVGDYKGLDDIQVTMMTPEMLEGWRASLRKYSGTIDLDADYTTQVARRGRGSTCSYNPYSRRSTYCNTNEVEAPVEQELASTEFGSCLLDSAPIKLETLVGCRSDACTPNPYFNYFKYYR